VQLGDMNSDANHYAYPILSDSTYQTLVRAPGQTGVGASLNEWHMATTVCNADSGNMSLDAWREGQSEYHGAEDFRTSYASDWTPGYASYFSQIRTPYSTYTYNNSFDGFVDFVLYMNEVISDARRLEIWELHKAGEL